MQSSDFLLPLGISGWLIGIGLFILGWVAANIEIKKKKKHLQRTQNAYLTGLAHLLEERQAQAVDAFIQALENDPVTSELHFALGNLFRKRGDYDHAIRLHQSLIDHSSNSQDLQVDKARLALAEDYYKAGLYDHVEKFVDPIQDKNFKLRGLELVLRVRDRTSQWKSALACIESMQRISNTPLPNQISHYWCELALIYPTDAQNYIEQALTANPHALRPKLLLLFQYLTDKHEEKILHSLQTITQQHPQYLGIVAQQLCEKLPTVTLPDTTSQRIIECLHSWFEIAPNLSLLKSLCLISNDSQRNITLCMKFAQQNPSLLASYHLLEAVLQNKQTLAELNRNILSTVYESLASSYKTLNRYQCSACQVELLSFNWRCVVCHGWDTIHPLRIGEITRL